LDFQVAVYASPAIDLIYSLYFNLSHENRAKYRDDYIMYYHSEFVKALKSYGYLKNPPSLLDLHVELLKNGIIEAIVLICFIVFQFIDWTTIKPETAFDPEKMNEFKRICFKSPEYRKIVEKEFPRLIYKGMI
jgi:hypothetical protein